MVDKNKYFNLYLSNLNNEMIWVGRKRSSHTQFFKKGNKLDTYSLAVCLKTFKIYTVIDMQFSFQQFSIGNLNKNGWTQNYIQRYSLLLRSKNIDSTYNS